MKNERDLPTGCLVAALIGFVAFWVLLIWALIKFIVS